MRGKDIASALPAKSGARREKLILDAVRRRQIAPIQWTRISTRHGGETAYFEVSNDALRLGDATDSFRAAVTHPTAQLIADDLGVYLPTAKLSDEIWAQAKVVLPPLPHKTWSECCPVTMSNTSRMLEQSKLVDKLIGGRGGLTADVGKDWVNTRWGPSSCRHGAGNCAVNYGWHAKDGLPSKAATLRGGTVWQPVSFFHHKGHTDYSQVVRMIKPMVRLCNDESGSCRDLHIQSIASDPIRSALLSHDGALLLRYPGVVGRCPIRGSCPAPGTPIKGFLPPAEPPTENNNPSLECPDLDCEDPVPPEPLLHAVVGGSRSGAAALLSFAAGGLVGFLAVRAFLPRF